MTPAVKMVFKASWRERRPGALLLLLLVVVVVDIVIVIAVLVDVHATTVKEQKHANTAKVSSVFERTVRMVDLFDLEVRY